MKDRSDWPVRKMRLKDEDPDLDYLQFTPAECFAMVWEMTKTAWAFMGKKIDEPGLSRHVVRIKRRGRRVPIENRKTAALPKGKAKVKRPKRVGNRTGQGTKKK